MPEPTWPSAMPGDGDPSTTHVWWRRAQQLATNGELPDGVVDLRPTDGGQPESPTRSELPARAEGVTRGGLPARGETPAPMVSGEMPNGSSLIAALVRSRSPEASEQRAADLFTPSRPEPRPETRPEPRYQEPGHQEPRYPEQYPQSRYPESRYPESRYPDSGYQEPQPPQAVQPTPAAEYGTSVSDLGFSAQFDHQFPVLPRGQEAPPPTGALYAAPGAVVSPRTTSGAVIGPETSALTTAMATARPGDPQAPTRLTRPQQGVHSSWRTALGEASRSLPRGSVPLAVALVAIIGLGLITWALLRNTGGSGTPAAKTSASQSSSAAVSATAVPANTVTAVSSSTSPKDGNITYVAANTLDGKPETAWNSDGDSLGATLTYTFASPIHLRSISVLDGYQKTGKGGADLWSMNSRVKQFQVTTQTGTFTWDLDDTKDAQALTQDLGLTGSVVLKVTAIYPGSKYHDIGVSETTFTAG